MFYVTNCYTDEILGVFDTFDAAKNFADTLPDTEVTDENDNYFYSHIEVPF